MNSPLFRSVLFVGVLLTVSGCAAHPPIQLNVPASTTFQTLISDRLYFGRSIPNGGVVSEADWEKFMTEVVTPRFPAGLSVWRAQGQWRDKDSVIQREESSILDILHPDDSTSEQSVQEIMTEYKVRFRQEAVLRVRDSVSVQFW